MQNQTEIRTWSVSWSIDLEATSAEQAAAMAARDYMQAGHTATVFNVAPMAMVADNWGMPGEPVEVDAAQLPVLRPDNPLELLGQDLEEYSLTSDWDRADVLAHIAHNMASLLPHDAVKAAIDCAFADVLICLEPSRSQEKADTLRRMMEGPQ